VGLFTKTAVGWIGPAGHIIWLISTLAVLGKVEMVL
jgi:hypothetical protein